MSPYLACNWNLSRNWTGVILPMRSESQSTIYCKTISTQWSRVTFPQLQGEMSPSLKNNFSVLYQRCTRNKTASHHPFPIIVRCEFPYDISKFLTNLWAMQALCCCWQNSNIHLHKFTAYHKNWLEQNLQDSAAYTYAYKYLTFCIHVILSVNNYIWHNLRDSQGRHPCHS
jgi:hypothetical protein